MLNDKWYRIAASRAYGYLEVPSIGWQLFILESYQSDSTAFPSCLDTYATRLLTEPLSHMGVREVNVILVILDSLRKDHIGVYRKDRIQTPNLDALAKESLRFSRAY